MSDTATTITTPARTIWSVTLRRRRPTAMPIGTNARVLAVLPQGGFGERTAVYVEHDAPEITAQDIADGLDKAQPTEVLHLVRVLTGQRTPNGTYVGSAAASPRAAHVYLIDQGEADRLNAEQDAREQAAADAAAERAAWGDQLTGDAATLQAATLTLINGALDASGQPPVTDITFADDPTGATDADA